MVKYIWSFLIISGIVYGICTGDIATINNEIIKSGSSTLDLMLVTIPLLIIWMGLLKIAEDAHLIDYLVKYVIWVIKPLFPKVKNIKALNYIASNVIANMIGLGSAATPFGLKAMQELQKENLKKDTASSSMITFLVLNTSGVTIIPTTVLAMRLMHHSINPEAIIITSILSTIMASLGGLIVDYIIRRINHDY